MTQRDECLAEVQESKAELAGLPLKDFDIDKWYADEVRRVHSIPLAEFHAEWIAAERVDDAEKRRLRTLELLRDRIMSERRCRLHRICDNENLLRNQLLPTKLAEAIRRTESEVNAIGELARAKQVEVNAAVSRLEETKNRERAGWTMKPPSTALTAEVNAATARQADVSLRLERIQTTLRKLRALALVPGDQDAAIVEILRERIESDFAADFAAPAVEQKPKQPQTEAEFLAAHGVTEGFEEVLAVLS